jgi:hypothetical protein
VDARQDGGARGLSTIKIQSGTIIPQTFCHRGSTGWERNWMRLKELETEHYEKASKYEKTDLAEKIIPRTAKVA